MDNDTLNLQYLSFDYVPIGTMWVFVITWRPSFIVNVLYIKLLLQSPPRAVTFSWWGDCVPQWSG